MIVYIENMFLHNLQRKNPGEEFSADIDVSFYQNSPVIDMAEQGLAYMEIVQKEDVYIDSYDHLKLHATLFPIENHPKKFVIGIHGFQSHALNEFAPHIQFYHSLGFSMLLVDDRAHGYSEGDYITMGVKDRLDCIAWAQYLVKRYGQDVQIILHGVSMGGATVLSASGEASLPKQVIGTISDCGFTSVEEALNVQIKNLFHIPSSFIVQVCKSVALYRAKFDFDEAKPIEQVKHSKVPILFVQGSEDRIVPSYMAEKLYEACSTKKKLLLVENANHAESIAMDTKAYHDAICELFQIERNSLYGNVFDRKKQHTRNIDHSTIC